MLGSMDVKKKNFILFFISLPSTEKKLVKQQLKKLYKTCNRNKLPALTEHFKEI